jgi:hypothetical protein
MNSIRLVVWILEQALSSNIRELVVINVSEIGNVMYESVHSIANHSISKKIVEAVE